MRAAALQARWKAQKGFEVNTATANIKNRGTHFTRAKILPEELRKRCAVIELKRLRELPRIWPQPHTWSEPGSVSQAVLN